MTTPAAETVSVVVERDLPWPPARIWRALTQPHLIEEWLMKTDFAPEVGNTFQFRADWGVVDCEVLEIEPNRALVYTWEAFNMKTVVTYTLTPTAAGAHLRIEQAGFLATPEHRRFVQGAEHGWRGFVDKLEQVVARDG
jgi:uncharacterized protein YndB with AHSA1/START domain